MLRRQEGVPERVRDVARQLAIWVGLGLAYEAVRGIAGHDRAKAIRDGRVIVHLEQHLGLLFEPHLEHDLIPEGALASTVRWSYWVSEFAVLILAILWVYIRDRDLYARFRDSVLVANGFGLVGYLLVPTAPPRIFTGYGFTNAVSGQPSPSHATGLLGFAANPYAAMPSLHVADALLAAIFLAALSNRVLVRVACSLWPVWVCFAVLASGNHFWLDLVGGAVVATAGLFASRWLGRHDLPAGAIRRRLARDPV
jgi:membrane-associated phospholipid phosphatase